MSEKPGLIFLRRCVEQGRTPDAGDLRLILRDFAALKRDLENTNKAYDKVLLLLRDAKNALLTAEEQDDKPLTVAASEGLETTAGQWQRGARR